jgi:malonyl-CoA/methylmalonyl-CoA synthetase
MAPSTDGATRAPADTPPWARHLPAGTDPASVDLLHEGSLPAAWARRWRAAPDADAVVTDTMTVSARELDARTRAVAARFSAAGATPGDRVLMSAATSVDLVVAHVAAMRLGLVVVPVNGAYQEREVAHIARDCEPRFAVVDEPARGEWIRSAVGDDVIVTSPAVELPAGDITAVVLDAASPRDLALLVYTSGTTGTPKGAMLTHGNALASSEAVRIAWRWTAADRLVLALPLFHVHGLGVGLHGALLCGGAAILVPHFSPDTVLDAAARDATLFFGVPTMYARLADSPRVGELARLRLCVSGSAPLAPEIHERITAASGVHVLERYGMTETVMNVSNPYDGERRPGTVGFPLPGVEVRLDSGAASVDGIGGEILLRGPNVFPGYWRRDEATRDAFDDDGWFRSGDVGAFDDDGYLRIIGRAKELIITGGYNVYPREVEDVLLEHPAVAEVAVVGEPSTEWGETVVAVVVPADPADLAAGVDADDLLAFARERLAPFKCPRRVRTVAALPRNALGKLLRHEI